MKDFDHKKKIIAYFRARGLDYVSGEELSEEFGFSRANVWKYMSKLRDEGYGIEAVPHLGYRLMSVPDRILPYEIDVELKTKVFGKSEVHCHDEIASTNDEAYRLAEKGAAEGTIVLAECQTKGKGRVGRKWSSPKGGGIYLSLILRPDAETDEIPSITLIAASAVVKVIRKECSLEAVVKWPNDVFVGGKKVCGILTEMKAQPDSVEFLVLGIGININTPAGKLPPEGTSLAVQASRTFDRTVLLRSLLEALERDYRKFSSSGFMPLRDECKAFSLVLGEHVNITEHHKKIEGRAVDIDEKGALIVRTTAGAIKRVFSGDVVMCR